MIIIMKAWLRTIQMIRSILSIILICPLIYCSIINSYASDVFFIEVDEEKTYSNTTIDGAFADNRVLVMLKNDVSLEFNEYEVTDFPEINCNSVKDMSHSDAQIAQEKIKELRRDGILGVYSAKTAKNADIVSSYNQILCIELDNAGKENVIEAINALQKRDDVLYVGPDFEISISSTNESYVSEDDYYNEQWALDNIQLPETWELIDLLSKDTVTVGVLDTGIDADHPDFIKNNNETIVNVSRSRDFTDGSADCVSQLTDPNGHGTHVAGIIGAIGDNDEGIAGACWDVELVSLRVFNEEGDGYASYLINAIEYVTENTDIKILNFSGGWSGTPDEENDNILWYDPEEDYILEAKISTFDGLFVCSAGNDNNNNDINPRYPSDYNLDNMITVGASVENDGIWSNSNFGMDTVDLFAPGDNIYSLSNSDWYCEESGTSMAAPFVTGVAAIMLSINPTLTPEEIKAFIMGNVDCEIVSDSGTRYPYIGKCVSGGRLNAYEAVNAMLEACVHSRVRYTNVSSSKHKKECLYCEIIISYENHTLSSVSLGYNKHTTSCTKCSYSIEEDHDLYLYADYGEDGFDVKCRDCSYTDGCSEEYEYYSTDEGHYISCSCGSVYFFDEHSPGTYTNINNVSHRIECYACDYIYTETHNLRCLRANNLYYHDVKCTDCTYNTTEAHNWIRRGTGYLCTICGQSEAFIPSDVMSLPDPELRIYLASLSDEDLDSFIASLPEDRLDRATALLPPENDDELSGE